MKENNDIIARVDGYTRFCLTAITVLLGLLVIGLWADPVAFTTRTLAADPGYRDTEAQRAVQEGRWGTSSAPNKLAAVQAKTNEKLDELIGLFTGGKAKVQIVEGSTAGRGGSNVRKSRKK